MKGVRNIGLVFAALTFAGCSLIIDDNTPRVTNHCAADLDCSAGAHCDTAAAMCVQEPSLGYDLWLEVAPPNDPSGAAVTPADLGPYTSFLGAIPLVVPRQVNARGTVRTQDGRPVTAQITFIPTAMTPIGARTISTRTTPSMGDVDFATSLPSRADYDVLVEPLGDFRASDPPYRFSLSVGGTDSALQVVLPAAEHHIEGDLVDPAGSPLVGFEVLAVDRASGALRSSVATITLDSATPGHFAIALTDTSVPFDLVVRPTMARQAMGLVPTYRVRPELLLPDAHGLVRVLVPQGLPAVHWAGTVEYPETRGVRPVASAVVQLHSDDVVDASTGVVGSLDITMNTDADGRYDGFVLPGTYTISITPSLDAELGVLRETRDLRPTAGVAEILGHVFHLPLRTLVSGTVLSPDGDLMRDANVRATPLGVPLAGLTDPDIARLARPSTALSGPMGDFRLELDVGVYDLTAEAPEGSGFPWTVTLDYGIGGSATTPPVMMQVDAPVVVDTDVTWLDGGELTGAEVRAFAITPDGRAVMVGRTTGDAHGHARLLVPATLDSHQSTTALRR